MIMAMPMPPPTHMVSRPRVPSVLRSPLIRVPVIRAPLIPKGCPRAMAPPPQGDGPAVHVECVGVDAQVAVAGDDLGGEGLVDLDEVEVVDGHAGAGQRLAGRLDRAVTHQFGGQAGDA